MDPSTVMKNYYSLIVLGGEIRHMSYLQPDKKKADVGIMVREMQIAGVPCAE